MCQILRRRRLCLRSVQTLLRKADSWNVVHNITDTPLSAALTSSPMAAVNRRKQRKPVVDDEEDDDLLLDSLHKTKRQVKQTLGLDDDESIDSDVDVRDVLVKKPKSRRSWMYLLGVGVLLVSVVLFKLGEDSFLSMAGYGAQLADKDLYAVLGVAKSMNTAAIRKAYRKLSLQYHPDRAHERTTVAAEAKAEAKPVCAGRECAEKYNKITQAYKVLVNPESRKIYDQTGYFVTDFGSFTEFKQPTANNEIFLTKTLWQNSILPSLDVNSPNKRVWFILVAEPGKRNSEIIIDAWKDIAPLYQGIASFVRVSTKQPEMDLLPMKIRQSPAVLVLRPGLVPDLYPMFDFSVENFVEWTSDAFPTNSLINFNVPNAMDMLFRPPNATAAPRGWRSIFVPPTESKRIVFLTTASGKLPMTIKSWVVKFNSLVEFHYAKDVGRIIMRRAGTKNVSNALMAGKKRGKNELEMSSIVADGISRLVTTKWTDETLERVYKQRAESYLNFLALLNQSSPFPLTQQNIDLLCRESLFDSADGKLDGHSVCVLNFDSGEVDAAKICEQMESEMSAKRKADADADTDADGDDEDDTEELEEDDAGHSVPRHYCFEFQADWQNMATLFSNVDLLTNYPIANDKVKGLALTSTKFADIRPIMADGRILPARDLPGACGSTFKAPAGLNIGHSSRCPIVRLATRGAYPCMPEFPRAWHEQLGCWALYHFVREPFRAAKFWLLKPSK